jgi:ribosome assembly protein YihI (activator of Der GTPase)
MKYVLYLETETNYPKKDIIEAIQNIIIDGIENYKFVDITGDIIQEFWDNVPIIVEDEEEDEDVINALTKN